MIQQQAKLLAPVIREVIVNMSPQRAFDVFIGQIGNWWPERHSLVQGVRKDVVIEAKPGGRWYETGEDGNQIQWGEVLDIEPGKRLLLSWQLSDVWKFDPDLRSEVEVTFDMDGDKTRVVLAHRNFECMGDNVQTAYDSISSDAGWLAIMHAYQNATSS